MTASRDSDLIRRVQALEDEIYGRDRKGGLRGKILDLWEWRTMGKGVAWFISGCAALGLTLIGLAIALFKPG